MKFVDSTQLSTGALKALRRLPSSHFTIHIFLSHMSAALQFCAPAENPFPKEDDEARRHFLSKVIVSGAIGGAVADSSMHIIDTVKTRMVC